MKAAIVIPARYGSQRLPGKPLLRETGKYLIQHVYERAMQAALARQVIVATDDPRIVAAVKSFGGIVRLTRRGHINGAERVAEVAADLDEEIIVNLQGDEPFIEPTGLDRLIELMRSNTSADVATLAAPIRSAAAWRDPSCVKVVCDEGGRALYFSRSPIPFVRDGEPDFSLTPPRFLQHIGVYAYRTQFLARLAATAPHPLENIEKLEQLRFLAMGQRVQVGIVPSATAGVDTYLNYQRFVRDYRAERRRLAG
jgi:3-deoxy-manno-octulosonate cytidylyltransferase (CMP-KDO synthetase)